MRGKTIELMGVYALLLVLLGLTVLLASLHLGALLGGAVALLIAALKALLVAFLFMEVGRDEQLTSLFGMLGLVWLGVLLSLAMTDYVSRGWLATGQ